MPIVPLFGTGFTGKSSNVTAQKRINLYAENFSDQDKTPRALYTRPGLNLITQTIAASGDASNGPLLGAIDLYLRDGTNQGEYVVAAHHGAFRVWTGRTTYMQGGGGGDPGPAGSPVSIAYNGLRCFAVDGANAWWIAPANASYYAVSTSPSTFSWTGADSVCFIAGRFVVNCPEYVGQFAWSALNAGVMSTWDALDYATAESIPDALVAVWECRGELVLFGTESIEHWAPSGDSSVFARTGGATVTWGLGSRDTVAKHSDGLIFVGRNKLGSLQVAGMAGYQVQPLSTPDIDEYLNAAGAINGARAFVTTIEGHAFYVLNLQAKTLVYDLTSGQWDEWQTDGGRFAGNVGFFAYGAYIVSDYRDEKVYELTADALTDNGSVIVKEVTTRHAFSNLDRMGVDEIVLDAEMGVGLSTGQGSDPKVMMQVSKDGGHTFGNEMWRSLGKRGQYGVRAQWLRLGRARDWVFRWRITDAVKVVIMNAAARISG